MKAEMSHAMRTLPVCIGVIFAFSACAQSTPDHELSKKEQKELSKKKAKRSPGGDIGSGAGNIGTGVAKGAGSAASGAAKGAVDLATLHPIDAAAAVGGGAVKGGASVAVGTAKGAGKIGKGIGRAFKKVL